MHPVVHTRKGSAHPIAHIGTHWRGSAHPTVHTGRGSVHPIVHTGRGSAHPTVHPIAHTESVMHLAKNLEVIKT